MSILILVRLLAAHLVADFLLQPTRWVNSKNKLRGRSPYLYLHALIHGAITYLFLGMWTDFRVPLLVLGTHLVIDLGKASFARKGLPAFLMDQTLHVAVLVAGWLLLTGQGPLLWEKTAELLASSRVWILFTAYLLVLFPSGAAISMATRRWCRQLEDRQGLAEAGKWIGYSERFLILSFILLNRYEAIGFLIAAKSVFRFNEIMKDKERKEAEYFLIGTLFSISLALAIGLLTQAIY